MATLTRYPEIMVEVARLTDKAIGIATGETEEVLDPRDGYVTTRDKLAWLPRSKVALLAGRLAVGETVRLEVPNWLMKKHGLDEPREPGSHDE